MDVSRECTGDLVEALNTRIHGNGTQTLVLSHGFGADQSVWHYLIPYLACYFKIVVFDLVFSPNVSPKLYILRGTHVLAPMQRTWFAFLISSISTSVSTLVIPPYFLFLRERVESYGRNRNPFNCGSIFIPFSSSILVEIFHAALRFYYQRKRDSCIPTVASNTETQCKNYSHLNVEGGKYYGGFERSYLDMVFNNIAHNFSGWVRDFAPKAIGGNDTTAIHEFERSLGRMKPDIALSAARTVFLSDNRAILSRVRVPSAIQSQKDFIVPLSVAFYMKKKLHGHVRVRILKTEGHFPELTAYPLLINVLKKVLHLTT
ncbi:hypothetical protein RJ639_004650 [Escallonia herrerae]|uniref:AB hydrolase-1 domain-containing protein n=1 Tax=Escallonia herrerae TaxID=1293975 RepID=A0AA88W9V5_9ASTE|nr:hypothetical protein RJ639_004650 [Escallonia herrerae]